MEIDTNYQRIEKTARYASYGTLSAETKYFWFALHGTKMRCEQMLYKFSEFDPKTHFIVAPEGLSRFYLNGFGGDVVATWMTKRDRLHEIDDFSSYLSGLFSKYEKQLSSDCKKVVLGFSQGGTTTFRWLHHHQVNADFAIAYSAWLPEDIDLTQSKTNLNDRPLIFTYGRQDEFLQADRIDFVKSVIDKNKLNFSIEAYDGIHRIEKDQLKFLFDTYIK